MYIYIVYRITNQLRIIARIQYSLIGSISLIRNYTQYNNHWQNENNKKFNLFTIVQKEANKKRKIGRLNSEQMSNNGKITIAMVYYNLFLLFTIKHGAIKCSYFWCECECIYIVYWKIT